jgi:hypothetical protein
MPGKTHEPVSATTPTEEPWRCPGGPSTSHEGTQEPIMRRTITLIAAAAFFIAPATAFADPPAPESISPAHETGQPGVECGEDDALGSPGRASDARGSAFNEDGIGHAHYAGEQDQNSKNTASISQYDVACANVPQPR